MADLQRKTANLYNINAKDINNGYIDNVKLKQDGTTETFSPCEVTEYIELVPNVSYRLSNIGSYNSLAYCIYDENKQYITGEQYSGQPVKAINMPPNGKYVRLSHFKTRTETMLNEGSTAKPYEPYGWVHSLRKLTTATDTFTTLPVDVYADGNNATVGLKGNTTQSGTPTRDNPIMPQGTGERTGNLWNEDYTGIRGSLKYVPVFVGNGTFTLSTDTPDLSGNAPLFLLSGNVTSGASTPTNGVYNVISRTTDSLNGYITIAFRRQSELSDPTTHKTMLNLGSTALPYEPYGFEISISSAGQTNNINLGVVETTRKIRKLVLTGGTDEEYVYDPSYTRVYFVISNMLGIGVGLTPLYCTHYQNISDGRPIGDVPNNSIYTGGGIDADKVFIKTMDYTSVADFKAYLAQQYAAGTPVCVWYVLATETTGIVNEPLMKIGDYADTVSGITIPTITGKDTFDVETTLKPSEASISYTGWHDATVEEWDGSDWQ